MVITHMEYENRPCLVTAQQQDGKLDYLHLDNPQEHKLLGSIHVGKVQKVLPNIKGAFIEIENRIPCFYPLAKQSNPIYKNGKKDGELKAGDELLVQVTQEALKTKAPCVSSNLNFSGNYLVLTTGNHTIGMSGKLSFGKKEFWKLFLEEELPEQRNFGVVVRTNAEHASKEQVKEELDRLKNEMELVIKRGSFNPCCTKIRKADSPVLAELKNIYWQDMEKIITDDTEIYESVKEYVDGLHLDTPCQVELYQDKLLPLYKLFSLESGLDEALSERVWLKSGGFLIIQQTEAFVAIDVNTGKNMEKKDAQEICRKTNLEAAQEIARQLKLRNLYGMILIDFINMNKKENQEELLGAMKKYVVKDRVKTTVVDITALGIMELTRKKEQKSIFEQIRNLETKR